MTDMMTWEERQGVDLTMTRSGTYLNEFVVLSLLSSD